MRPGCQFAPVHYNGQTFLPGQANNFYIFPAIGMAIFATQAERVTDEMFIEAGQAVADQVPPELLKQGLLYPLQSNILETEIQTAARVAKLVFDSGLARVERPRRHGRIHPSAMFTSRSMRWKRHRRQRRPSYPKVAPSPRHCHDEGCPERRGVCQLGNRTKANTCSCRALALAHLIGRSGVLLTGHCV